ncbi:MAG: transposase [Methanosarcinaceae archaeon]
MKAPLIPLNEDFKWKLLSEILNVFDLRSTRQILSRRGILPLHKSVPILKIVIMSMFFSSEISYAVRELKARESLRDFLRIDIVPSEHEIYDLMSKFDSDNFTNFVIELLNSQFPKRKTGSKGIIIDSTDINLNLNWYAKKITKKSLENKDYKWGYSTHRGFFIGLKLTLALESQTLKPLAFLINEANVPEPKIYLDILKELKRRRILKTGDVVYADRGYYSYDNYVVSIKKFRIVPLIFPRKNCNFEKLFSMLNYPLKIFDPKRDTKKEIKIYQQIVGKFKSMITEWKEFRPVRSIIEDIFKLAKKAYSMENLHRYTRVSVQKYCSLAVLLVGMTVNCGINEKKELQAFSE